MLGIYARISGNKVEGKDTSIEIQQSEGIKVALQLGMKYKLYSDIGITGTKDEIDDRPAFAEMFRDIDKGIISAVYVMYQDRLEREPRIWELFKFQVNKMNCKYYPNGVETDLTDAQTQFFTGVLSLTNKLYANLTRDKAIKTFDKRAEEGKTHGIIPYGYEKADDGGYKINEFEGKIVKRIYQMSLDGSGAYTIAKKLNEDGIKTKFNNNTSKKTTFKRKDSYTNEITVFKKSDVEWRSSVIQSMLSNTTYYGLKIWNKIESRIPAIISEEMFEAVQKNLQKNRYKVGKKEEYNYLLNGLLYCGCCGKEYRGKKRLKGKDSAYKCKDGGKCQVSRGIGISRIEGFVIRHLFIDKNLKELLSNLPSNTEQSAGLKAKLEQLKSDLGKKEKEKTKWFNWMNDDEVDDSDVRAKYSETKRAIKVITDNLELVKVQLFEADNQIAKQRLETASNEYSITTSFEDTKKLIHSIIEIITITHLPQDKGGVFHIQIKYRGFEEIATFTTNWTGLEWKWINYYRNKATNYEQLSEDTERLKAFLDFKNIEYSDSDFDDYEGAESLTKMHSKIILNKEDLIEYY